MFNLNQTKTNEHKQKTKNLRRLLGRNMQVNFTENFKNLQSLSNPMNATLYWNLSHSPATRLDLILDNEHTHWPKQLTYIAAQEGTCQVYIVRWNHVHLEIKTLI